MNNHNKFDNGLKLIIYIKYMEYEIKLRESGNYTELEIQEKTGDNMLMNCLDTLVPIIERRIKTHHKDYSLPLLAEYWEEVLHRSLGEIGINTTWTPTRSHAVGEDMRIEGVTRSRISCKSGQITNNREHGQRVKFNGGRSTSHETLGDKIEHFCGDHDDYYFLLAKTKNFNKTYKLIIFESHMCRVDQLQWDDTPSGKQWKGRGPFEAVISKSMSAQLWTTFPLSLTENIHDIDCREQFIP